MNDRTARILLRTALFLHGCYVIVLLLDLTRPTAGPGDPVLSIFDTAVVSTFTRVVFWLAVTGWVVTAVTEAVGVLRRRDRPLPEWLPGDLILRFVAVAALLAPFSVMVVRTLLPHPLFFVLCLPTTAFGIWTVRRFQRWRPMPLGLSLAVAGWGAVVAVGFGNAMDDLVALVAVAHYADSGRLFEATYLANITMYISAGTMEEAGKGAAVALVFLLARRHLDGVVAGVVLGALAGLGFNLTETVHFMAQNNGAGAGVQYWLRQSVALLGAHTAFSAVVGAGFGLATRLDSRCDRLVAIGAGYLAAAGCHFTNNVVFEAQRVGDLPALLPGGGTVTALLGQPLLLVLLQGPLVAVYIVLIRQGTRSRAGEMAAELRSAVATSGGGVTEAEVPALLDPRQRTKVRAAALRRYGWPGLAAVRRLQTAQYALSGALRDDPDQVARLRARVEDERRLLRAAMAGRTATAVPA